MFIVQLIIIILLVRMLGYLFQKAGQPTVLGEICAGLLLGPSVLGILSPDAFQFLFPSSSLEILEKLSQLGLILFMFIVGMEMDLQSFRNSATKAFLIGLASIVFPFGAGFALAFFLAGETGPSDVTLTSFALFMGIVMSITAFPVLARIIQEKRLAKTTVGQMAIPAAAISDVSAWCMLAIVVAIVNAGSIFEAFLPIVLSVAYVFLMIYVVKPLMQRIGKVYGSRETMGKPIVALVFILLLASALITETIGIHALFGAFIAGTVMPDDLKFKQVFTEKIEDLALIVLLPLFFVSTGLRTQIGLINSPELWMVFVLIILTAVAGKFGGTLLASRITGLGWKESLSLGVLMNAKGLMELIVLNIGYELGILNAEIFAMLVLMALVTTFLTGPGLQLVGRFFPEPSPLTTSRKPLKCLVSFAHPEMGAMLLRLIRGFTGHVAGETAYQALHISPRTDLSPTDAIIFEQESFASIKREAALHDIPLHAIYRNTLDVATEIKEVCRAESPDFLIVGGARTLFGTDILGGILKKIVFDPPCDVLIFNERNLAAIQSVLIMQFDEDDDNLLNIAILFSRNHQIDLYRCRHGYSPVWEGAEGNDAGIAVTEVNEDDLQSGFLNKVDLVLLSVRNWRIIEYKYQLPAASFPSVLLYQRSAKRNRYLEYMRDPFRVDRGE